ncbi:MAG TPA: hypothetical protein VMU62_09850 [Acidobacteriaceae bacterium]|nr:hypothetical protein [Acidobacteriaceae bacterium]
MTSIFRKSILTAHITFSVGWLGAVAAFLALALAGLRSQDVQIVPVAYPAMEQVARFVIVPLAFAALLSGIIQSLSTPWGLFRHTWILVKLLLTIFSTLVLLKKMSLIHYAAHLAGSLTSFLNADFHFAGIQLVIHAAGGMLVLFAITILSVFKPWGLTRYGQRKLQERSTTPQPQYKNASEPMRINIVLAILGTLVVVAIALHLAGHPFHHTH